MIHGPKATKSFADEDVSVWLPFIVYKTNKETSVCFEEPVSETDVSTVVHFAAFVYVAVQ